MQNPLKMSTCSLMQVRSIKFADLLFASTAALALSNALPVQSLPQWVTIKGEGEDVMYDFNSVKSLPNGIKGVDTYFPKHKVAIVQYISCPRWRWNIAGSTEWEIMHPN